MVWLDKLKVHAKRMIARIVCHFDGREEWFVYLPGQRTGTHGFGCRRWCVGGNDAA